MKIKDVKVIKSQEPSASEKFEKTAEKLEDLSIFLLSNVKDIKNKYKIDDKNLGKKMKLIDEKLKNFYESFYFIKSLNTKEIERSENTVEEENNLENEKQAQDNLAASYIIEDKNARKVKVPSELADFIEVEEDTKLSKNEIMQEVWKQFENRNLIYEENNKVLRVDEEASELFDIPMSVNKATNPRDRHGLTYPALRKAVDKVLTV
jgi:hypothetical protein